MSIILNKSLKKFNPKLYPKDDYLKINISLGTSL